MEPQSLTWKTHEFEKKDRHQDWNWTVGFVAFIVAVIAFFYGNIFFGIFSLVAGGTMIFFAKREPREIAVTLTEKMAVVNGHEIAYTIIEKFWLDESGKTDKLLLATKKGVIPFFVIPLADVKADTVRSFLREHHLVESETPLSYSTQLFDRLGF